MILLPTPFTQRMKQMLHDEYEAFIQALNAEAPTSIRLNQYKPIAPHDSTLPEKTTHTVPWCEHAFYLQQRPLFTLDPHFHGGAYYVQEASSMFLAHILKHIYKNTPIRALDLCAAPGGKSTLLANLLSKDSLLVANEVIKSRATILKENIIKWGQDNIAVTNSDPTRFSSLKGSFDIILVDAPCSGEGMFRKDPQAINEWSENNLQLCADRQKRIIADIWDALAPEGYLIYSTCTYNPGENEAILEWIVSNFKAVSISIPHPFKNITPGYSDTCHGYRFYPHKTGGEGFFIGVIQKQDGEVLHLKKEKKTRQHMFPSTFKPYLPDLSQYDTYLAGETWGIIPKQHADILHHLSSKTGLIYKGCEIGEDLKGKIKPTHALALYHALNQKSIPTHEVELPTAIAYLKKENINIEAPAGAWTLLTYHALPIGWIKKVNNRINNYYPKEWRIKGNF